MVEIEDLFETLDAESSTAMGPDAVLAGAVAANRRRAVARAGTTVAAVVVLLGGVLFLSLDGRDDGPVVSQQPDPTTVTAAPTTTVPTGGLDPAGWEPGLRWDYGRALSLSPDRGLLEFNRVSVTWNSEGLGMPPQEPPTRVCPSSEDPDVPYVESADGFPVASGTDWRAEPVTFGNSDTADVDLSDTPRSYRLAPDVEVLHLANTDEQCAFVSDPRPDPVWETLSLDQLAAMLDDPTDFTKGQDTLTFDEAGTVTRIRLASGC